MAISLGVPLQWGYLENPKRASIVSFIEWKSLITAWIETQWKERVRMISPGQKTKRSLLPSCRGWAAAQLIEILIAMDKSFHEILSTTPWYSALSRQGAG